MIRGFLAFLLVSPLFFGCATPRQNVMTPDEVISKCPDPSWTHFFHQEIYGRNFWALAIPDCMGKEMLLVVSHPPSDDKVTSAGVKFLSLAIAESLLDWSQVAKLGSSRGIITSPSGLSTDVIFHYYSKKVED